MPVALVDEWVWVMMPDTKAVIDKMAQVEYNVWDVGEYVSVLVDCHKEVGDWQSWQHPHGDPAELFDDDVSKPHAVVKHHQGECFEECLGGESILA